MQSLTGPRSAAQTDRGLRHNRDPMERLLILLILALSRERQMTMSVRVSRVSHSTGKGLRANLTFLHPPE